MIRSRLLLLAPLVLLHTAAMSAQTAAPSGSATFALYCATCHGTSARGNGPMASSLTRPPADLTLIAKRNGGTFPMEMVAKVIDGRAPVKGHGGGEMPVWGDAFGKSADATPVADKIARIVSYLQSIQAKD